MKKNIIALSLLAIFVVSATAQDNRPERPQRPDPATVAKQMLADHDADKNGSLNKEELTKGLEAMRANRPQGPQQDRQGARNARPEGQREGQRPQQGQRQQQERPERGDMTEMFMQRNDADKNGELNAAELEAAFKNMGRGRPQGQGERPQGERQRPGNDK